MWWADAYCFPRGGSNLSRIAISNICRLKKNAISDIICSEAVLCSEHRPDTYCQCLAPRHLQATTPRWISSSLQACFTITRAGFPKGTRASASPRSRNYQSRPSESLHGHVPHVARTSCHGTASTPTLTRHVVITSLPIPKSV